MSFLILNYSIYYLDYVKLVDKFGNVPGVSAKADSKLHILFHRYKEHSRQVSKYKSSVIDKYFFGLLFYVHFSEFSKFIILRRNYLKIHSPKNIYL